MPFDSMAMAAIADEVGAVLGGRVQRILQPSAAAVGLAIYADGAQRWLLLSADARYARVHFTTGKLAKGFATPSSFVMLLRKYLEGAKLREAVQLPFERVLSLSFDGGEGAVRLISEVMGKHSNVILTDANDRVLGAIKIVTPKHSRVRPIMPGRQYSPPPHQARDERLFPLGPRIDPYRDGDEFQRMLRDGSPHEPVRPALMGLLPGCGPFLADQIAARATINPRTKLHEVDLERLRWAAGELYGLLSLRTWQPCTFLDSKGKQDFAPYQARDVAHLARVESLSVAVDLSLSQHESRDALGAARTTVLGTIHRAQRAVAGRVASLRQGLAAASEADAARDRGQLILSYAHSVEPRASQLEIPDLDMTIPLDSGLTASENAERAFRRYRKLRDAAKTVPRLLTRAESEAGRLADLEVFAQLADTEGALRDIERELAPPSDVTTKPDRKRPAKRGPMRYKRDGIIAIVGRTARENDEVTFGMARREDTWLHARQRTGAHVVLQGSDQLPDEVVGAGAQLAAYFSEGRADTRVDVDAALVRDVRKISGGPPGRVTYRHERTLRVQPSLEGWEKL